MMLTLMMMMMMMIMMMMMMMMMMLITPMTRKEKRKYFNSDCYVLTDVKTLTQNEDQRKKYRHRPPCPSHV